MVSIVFCSFPVHLIAACPRRNHVYVANRQTPRPQVNATVVSSNKEEPKSQVTVVTSNKDELVPSANCTEVYDVEVTYI